MQKISSSRRTIASFILIGILGFSLNVSAKKSTYQTANGLDIIGLGTITAGSIVRTRQSIKANLALSGLEANSAYTVWWVVFNKPENCMNPIAIRNSSCGEPDVPDAVFNAAGFITGSSGNANITAQLNAGKLSAGLQVLKPGVLKRGNGFKAELHMVISSHGPILPDILADQISYIGGGCNINTCADQAVIIFPAPSKEDKED